MSLDNLYLNEWMDETRPELDTQTISTLENQLEKRHRAPQIEESNRGL